MFLTEKLIDLSKQALTEHPSDRLHIIPAIKAVNSIREKAQLREASEESEPEHHASARMCLSLE
jgi:hypothetical protein